MDLKRFAVTLGVSGLVLTSLLGSGFRFFNRGNNVKTPAVQVQSAEKTQNSVWCITFQLLWNDLMDKYTNGKPVQLEGGNPAIVNELNKRIYTAEDISENSYYKVQGVINTKLKKEIETSIRKKFNEKSDVLGQIDWRVKDGYLFYAMLKKEFEFQRPFEILSSSPFDNSKDNVKYFGTTHDSHSSIRRNVEVLFYNNDEYAVKLFTKENEEVILYRTDKKDDFTTLYTFVKDNANIERMHNRDTIKIPNLEINKLISYDELCNKQILGTDERITKALQTIKFKMDNKGGSLKSEAVIGLMRTSLAPELIGRDFNFDKPFVLFLKEMGKDKPYFATRVETTEFLVLE